MGKDEHLTIDEVNATTGQPLAPVPNAVKFVHQCGVTVRDNVYISIQEWNKPAKLEGVSYVDERTKVCFGTSSLHVSPYRSWMMR